jgi:Na+/H+-translocating membrane pyrophosphatase
MVGMSHCIRERTNALYAVGNTNATIGNEFTTGSATLVSMAFFGVCISNASISTVDVL